MTLCPLCAYPAGEDAAECPTCGVIFAKLRARAERERKAAALVLETTPVPSRNPWRVRLAALSLVAVWMLGLGLYYRVELRRRPPRSKPLAVRGRSSVIVRDSYGLVGEVPVTTARPGSSRQDDPPPPPEPVPSKPDPFDE